MTARNAFAIALKTILLAIGLTFIFMLAATVSGLGRNATAASSGAAAAQAVNVLLLLFEASLVQSVVITYLVLEAKWGGWKISGALSLVVLNVWVQVADESQVYLRDRLSPNYITQVLVTGLVTAALFPPFAVWILRGFRRGAPEEPSEHAHWPVARWIGTLAATTVAFVVLYYLCGYYIAWQNPALRQFYSGTTEIRSFWGQMGWIWSSTPWMIPFQAGRGLLFVALTLPAVLMLRGGAARVALGTALMYAAWDGSVGLIVPNPILPASVAHSHLVELVVWGLLYGVFVGWLMGGGHVPAPAVSQSTKAA